MPTYSPYPVLIYPTHTNTDLSVNLGALSGLARIAALASIPDFLQGINLGLLFLEHDWGKSVFSRVSNHESPQHP